jgi:hypothetical protein
VASEKIRSKSLGERQHLRWNLDLQSEVIKYIKLPYIPIIVCSPIYEGVAKSFRTGRLERKLQMVQSVSLGAVVSLFCESV